MEFNIKDNKTKLMTFARAGYLARACVYLLMGFFTLLVVLGSSKGSETDSKGALRHILDQPFGHIFLFVLSLGLFSYSLWRFAQSFFDVAHTGTSKKAVVKRIGYAVGGITHTFLGIYALKLIFSISADSQSTEKGLAHWLLTQPFGQFLTAALALIVVGVGVAQFVIGWKNKYLKRLNIPGRFEKWLCPICKLGFWARGFIFILIGGFFLQAALHYNSHKAGGVAKAWSVLRDQPYGNFLILIVAAGFIAFAVYGFIEAKYKKPI